MLLTISDIQHQPEGQTFDCKSSQIDAKSLAVVIVAMANADGGTVVVGISDKTRQIEGVDQNETHLNELRRVPFDYCLPSVNARTELVPCKDKNGNDNHVLVFTIQPSLKVFANQADEVFLRVGDRSKKLTFDERFQLMNDKGQCDYEGTYRQGVTMEKLDFALVDDYCKRIGYSKSSMEFLQENEGFLCERQGKIYPSAASILLFAKNPQGFFPRATIRFIRYDGTEEKVGAEMNVIKDVTFNGTIRDQIEAAVAYLKTQVKEHTYHGSDGKFVTVAEYSDFVLQELVVNAACH